MKVRKFQTLMGRQVSLGYFIDRGFLGVRTLEGTNYSEWKTPLRKEGTCVKCETDKMVLIFPQRLICFFCFRDLKALREERRLLEARRRRLKDKIEETQAELNEVNQNIDDLEDTLSEYNA